MNGEPVHSAPHTGCRREHSYSPGVSCRDPPVPERFLSLPAIIFLFPPPGSPSPPEPRPPHLPPVPAGGYRVLPPPPWDQHPAPTPAPPHTLPWPKPCLLVSILCPVHMQPPLSCKELGAGRGAEGEHLHFHSSPGGSATHRVKASLLPATSPGNDIPKPFIQGSEGDRRAIMQICGHPRPFLQERVWSR